MIRPRCNDRRDHGDSAWCGGAGLDRRPRHGQRREPGVAARDWSALHHRCAEVGAEAIRRGARRSGGWRTIREGVEVKLSRHPETGETVILCRSADRRSKERAIHDKFSRRIEAALERLAARIVQLEEALDPATVKRQIGRILQQNPRAAARFTITLEPDELPGRLSPERRVQRLIRSTGPRCRRAPICCARTSPTGPINSSGKPTSNSPKPRPRFASRRIS